MLGRFQGMAAVRRVTREAPDTGDVRDARDAPGTPDPMTAISSRQSSGRTGDFTPGLAFTAFAAYRADSSSILLVREDRAPLAAQAVRALSAGREVALRGTYDTAGYRADADLLLWLAASDPDALQEALAQFRQTLLGSALLPVWSAFGVHSHSEAGSRGAAAWYRGESALDYVCVCSINHTSAWHALPVAEQRRLQAEGDRAFRYHADVIVSPAAAFGLGESESLLAIECDELAGIVDVTRDLATAATRSYISGPLSFFTGARRPLAEIVEALP